MTNTDKIICAHSESVGTGEIKSTCISNPLLFARPAEIHGDDGVEFVAKAETNEKPFSA